MRRRYHQALERLRMRAAGVDALPQLCLLGALAGLISGGVIIAFRLLVELAQMQFVPGGGTENYEALPLWLRFALPAGGGLVLAVLLGALPAASREVGIVHVMERLAYHQGYLPLRNALVQFMGAAVSIVSGQSVGREGPSAHLGAAGGSQLGQWLRLPNNSLRILVGSGVAAAIGASFNTPLAGVIFAMEVVMMEYTITGFAPVIVAAVSATTLSRAVFGSAPAFALPPMVLGSLTEMPYIAVMGLVLGCLAALFIRLIQGFSGLWTAWPAWLRLALGGTLVGLCAMPVPQVMGIGYDTVNSALLGEIGFGMLLAITAAKMLATAAGLGLGLPGGLIGPTLVFGATAGGAMGVIAFQWLPGSFSSPAFYALLGMGAMMGATLQAPLAALTAMLELTANPSIILPGMLVLIIAGLVSKELFGRNSVFLELMRARGLDYRDNPVMQALRRVGVASAMDRNIVVFPGVTMRAELRDALARQPTWILLKADGGKAVVMPAADLARWLAGQNADGNDGNEVDLFDIPAKRLSTAAIAFEATMQEALETLDAEDVETLCVVRRNVPGIEQTMGVLTRQQVENSYRV